MGYYHKGLSTVMKARLYGFPKIASPSVQWDPASRTGLVSLVCWLQQLEGRLCTPVFFSGDCSMADSFPDHLHTQKSVREEPAAGTSPPDVIILPGSAV